MNIYRWMVTGVIIVSVIFSLGFVKFRQVQAAIAMAESFPEPSAAVSTVVTEKSEYVPVTEVTGQAVATKIIELQNELSGAIDFVDFNGGDSVEKGQLLLSQIRIEEQAQLDAAKATLKQAENNFARMRQLVVTDKVSQQQYDAAEAELKIAGANVANLTSIIAKKQIVAPFSGQLGLETYQVGQYLPANSRLTTLVDNGPAIWVDFKLPQTHRTLDVGEQIEVSAISSSQSVVWNTATITARNSQINSLSRHLTYRAELPEGRKWLQHNEIVKIRVVSESSQVVKVPASAVIRSQDGARVFELAVDDSGQYRAKGISVEAGVRTGDEQLIQRGLVPGLLIATEGAFKLREGLLVYPDNLQASVAGADKSEG